jgi:hypothetical protein
LIGEKRIGRLLSVNVGLPRDVAWQGKTVHTGIWKAPVKGRRMARREVMPSLRMIDVRH